MKRLLPLAALALAGCKTMADPVVEVREVEVPTPVACIDPAEIPAEPPTIGQRFNGDAKHDLAILAPNAQALRNRECIMCGEGVAIPMRVAFDNLEEVKRPASEDPSFTELWRSAGGEEEAVYRTVQRWRSQGK